MDDGCPGCHTAGVGKPRYRLPTVLRSSRSTGHRSVRILPGELAACGQYGDGRSLPRVHNLSGSLFGSQPDAEPDSPGTEDFVVCVQGGKHRGCNTSSRHRRPDACKGARTEFDSPSSRLDGGRTDVLACGRRPVQRARRIRVKGVLAPAGLPNERKLVSGGTPPRMIGSRTQSI